MNAGPDSGPRGTGAQRSQPHLARGGSGRSLIASLLLFACFGDARGDRPVAPADLAVDQVVLKGGPRLLGSVLGREADGTVAVAVGRAWLKTTHPRFFDEALQEEAAETRAALTELRDRIAEWRKARPDEKELDFFL